MSLDQYKIKEPISAKISIEIDRIDPNPYQPRLDVENTNIDSLKNNIDGIGFIAEPILVVKNEDRFTLIDGHRRVLGAKKRGDARISALVYANINEKDILAITISTFSQKEGISVLEEAIFYQKAIDEGIFRNASDLAKKLGVTKKIITSRLIILKLPFEIKKSVKKKEYMNVEVLLKLNSFINSSIKDKLEIKVKSKDENVTEEDERVAKEYVHGEVLALFEMIRDNNLNQREAISLINETLNSNRDLPKVIKQSWGIYNEKGTKVKFNFDTKKLPDDKKQKAMEHIKALKELLVDKSN